MYSYTYYYYGDIKTALESETGLVPDFIDPGEKIILYFEAELTEEEKTALDNFMKARGYEYYDHQ